MSCLRSSLKLSPSLLSLTFDPMVCIGLFLRGYDVKYDAGRPLVERLNCWYVISISVFYLPLKTYRKTVLFSPHLKQFYRRKMCLICSLYHIYVFQCSVNDNIYVSIGSMIVYGGRVCLLWETNSVHRKCYPPHEAVKTISVTPPMISLLIGHKPAGCPVSHY